MITAGRGGSPPRPPCGELPGNSQPGWRISQRSIATPTTVRLRRRLHRGRRLDARFDEPEPGDSINRCGVGSMGTVKFSRWTGEALRASLCAVRHSRGVETLGVLMPLSVRQAVTGA